MTPPIAKDIDASRPDDILGHPRGLTVLFATEMWERFSYYGMSSLLVLYMVNYLFVPGRTGPMLGHDALTAALQFLFGPLGAQQKASQLYGLYSGLVYLTPIFGGLIADRLLGQRRTVVIGAVLMSIGHFMMAFESLFFLALMVLIIGSGAFKPNISTQVGGLYAPDDRRRDRAYTIFYVGINLGAFLAPLVCGTLGEKVGWHYGFSAAGIGMLIGLIVYLSGSKTLPAEEPRNTGRQHGDKPRLDAAQWRSVAALTAVAFLQIFFWIGYEQQGNTIALWANDHTDRTINLLFWTAEIPTTWFQAFNPLMIFLFTPFIIALWSWQARRHTEPSTITKMALGCCGLALANLILVVAAWRIGADGRVSWLWLVGYFVAATIGELYLSPIGLALAAKMAPAPIRSLVMGLWLATSFVGNILSGWVGGFWSTMAKADFFLMIAIIAALTGAAFWACNRPLKPILRE
jgi:POT family proton-dependent oligopeptide transporter